MTNVTRTAQTAISDALASQPSADDFRWAPPPKGYVRRDIDAAEAVPLVGRARGRIDRSLEEQPPILAETTPSGRLTLISGTDIAAYLLRLRCRQIPVWVRAPTGEISSP